MQRDGSGHGANGGNGTEEEEEEEEVEVEQETPTHTHRERGFVIIIDKKAAVRDTRINSLPSATTRHHADGWGYGWGDGGGGVGWDVESWRERVQNLKFL